jgi:hypothetical protein
MYKWRKKGKTLYISISIIRGCALILILHIACLTLKSLRNVYFSRIKCSLNVKYFDYVLFLFFHNFYSLKTILCFLFFVFINRQVTFDRMVMILHRTYNSFSLFAMQLDYCNIQRVFEQKKELSLFI